MGSWPGWVPDLLRNVGQELDVSRLLSGDHCLLPAWPLGGALASWHVIPAGSENPDLWAFIVQPGLMSFLIILPAGSGLPLALWARSILIFDPAEPRGQDSCWLIAYPFPSPSSCLLIGPLPQWSPGLPLALLGYVWEWGLNGVRHSCPW